ncbi:MAG: LamG domain-containing protein, partial [Patescibacteria group bacterium]|nr:LamG domain-containing protein [Patescibacteria group bacterium]
MFRLKKKQLFFPVVAVISVVVMVFFISYSLSQTANRAVLDISLSSDNYESSTKTFTDRSGLGNDGISANNATFTTGRYGSIDGTMSFNGTSDYVLGNSNLGIYGNAEFTMSAWVYWEDISWSSNYPSAIGNNSTGLVNRGLSMTFKDGRPAIDFWNNRYRANNALNVRTWYHVTVVKTPGLIGSTSKIYVNGIQVSGTVEGSNVAPDIIDAPFVIGRLDATRWFKGKIEGVRIYNYALSDEEVENLYDSERSVMSLSSLASDGLIGHWSMDVNKDDEYTENIAPYVDYSNRTYDQEYTPSCWGGDTGVAYYYEDGGFNNLPYKKLIKTGGGTGGCYLDDNRYLTIEDNKTYIISAYMKANRVQAFSGHLLNINRGADN